VRCALRRARRGLTPRASAGLRRNPPLRDKAFAGAVMAALAHAGYIMSSDSTV
jgi:hypothetical protein